MKMIGNVKRKSKHFSRDGIIYCDPWMCLMCHNVVYTGVRSLTPTETREARSTPWKAPERV